MGRPVIAILASGEGTTAESFIRDSAEGKIEPEVGLIIVSNSKAGILQRVEKLNKEYGLNVATKHIGNKNYPNPSQEEAELLKELRAGNFDAIVLMGYMKKIGPSIVKEFGWRADYTDPHQAMMLNTHPGLLPETKGMFGIHVQEHVISNGLEEAGHTVHIVAEDYDDGPTIAEHCLAVLPGETPDGLFDRVKIIEKQELPHDVEKFINERKRRTT